jgi:hypothetical protein
MYVSLKVLGIRIWSRGSGSISQRYGSGSISQRYGSGSGSDSLSFPFLTKVLSGLKDWLQNKILTDNFSKN